MDVKRARARRRRRARAVAAGAEGGVPAVGGRRRARCSRRSRSTAPALSRAEYTLDELVDELDRPEPRPARRERAQAARRTTPSTAAWRSSPRSRTDSGSRRTIAIESEDPALVIAAVRELGSRSRRTSCLAARAQGARRLRRSGTRSIDVGTNSVKFHVGERRADGAWTTIVDRAEVTRLGEGLDETGGLQDQPMERTVEAIAGMADEARRDGVAGDRRGRHRRAADRAEQRRARRGRARAHAASRSR